MRNKGLNGVWLLALVVGVAHCTSSSDATLVDTGGSSSGAAPSQGDRRATRASNGSPAEATGVNGASSGAGGTFDTSPSCAFLSKDPRFFVMSSDDSNSMGSPVYAREVLRSTAPTTLDPAQFRTHEFLNYYNVRYEGSPTGSIDLIAQLQMGPGATEARLQIGVQAPPIAKTARPTAVTMVVDTSSSMTGAGMTRARAVMEAIASSLSPGDRVSLVTLNPDGPVQLEGIQVSGPGDPGVVKRVKTLYADGSSDLQAGLVTGYRLADKFFLPGGVNRLVLISDGRVTPGHWERLLIEREAMDGDKRGIYLVGVAVGPAKGYSDAMMNFVTEAGRGAYVYIDSEGEARRIFQERWGEVMDIAARDVRLELTLPWYFDIASFYGEGYSTDPSAVTGQHLAPGDAMIFNQHLVGCKEADMTVDNDVTATATWETVDRLDRQSITVTRKLNELIVSKSPQMTKANAIIAYAEALRTFNEARLHSAHEVLVAARAELPNDADLKEIEELIKLHPAY